MNSLVKPLLAEAINALVGAAVFWLVVTFLIEIPITFFGAVLIVALVRIAASDAISKDIFK